MRPFIFMPKFSHSSKMLYGSQLIRVSFCECRKKVKYLSTWSNEVVKGRSPSFMEAVKARLGLLWCAEIECRFYPF